MLVLDCTDTMEYQPDPSSPLKLLRSKSLPSTDATYGLGNVLPAVKLMYHPSMKELAEKISAIVQEKKLHEDKTISVSVMEEHIYTVNDTWCTHAE